MLSAVDVFALGGWKAHASQKRDLLSFLIKKQNGEFSDLKKKALDIREQLLRDCARGSLQDIQTDLKALHMSIN